MHATIGKAELQSSTVQITPELPTFKPRWWYRNDRLDARPVIWSLKNRPEEWEPADRRPHWMLKHKPSGHVFRIAFGPARLVAPTDCGCLQNSVGRFQRFQSWRLKWAAAEWISKNETPPVDHEQFANHFIH